MFHKRSKKVWTNTPNGYAGGVQKNPWVQNNGIRIKVWFCVFGEKLMRLARNDAENVQHINMIPIDWMNEWTIHYQMVSNENSTTLDADRTYLVLNHAIQN